MSRTMMLEDLSSLPGYINAPNAVMDAWLDQIRKLLMDKLSQGPILV